MNRVFTAGALCLLIAIISLAATSAPAQAPAPAAPWTLWNFLGIPQGWHKLKDATVNRRGNHPQRERKPPLKSLADPANLESSNPAINKAAEIKQQEDLKKQKIKAIKYLATIGCGCYPNVKKALMAALDDCTEEVRYEAAVAFCMAAGDPCQVCDGDGCCAADVMTKLHEMAYGRDAEGCFKEPSARVRQAAANALNACREATGSETNILPVEEPEQPKKEVPLEPIPEQKEASSHKPAAGQFIWVDDAAPEEPEESASPSAAKETPEKPITDNAPAASMVQPAGYAAD